MARHLGLLLGLLICLTFSAPPAAALTDTFTSSGTWTAPAGVTSVTVEAWGGGGAGGGARGNPSGGGGGAGGQYVQKVVAVVPGNSYAVVVGTGGAGSTGNGGTGGDSSFNGTTVVAKGGAGGIAAVSNNTGGAAGAGSTSGGIGDVVVAGGNGSAGTAAQGGAGGSGGGVGGAGGAARSSSGNGNSGNVAGGGGGGGFAGNNADRSGGAGARGEVSITYTIPPPPTVVAFTRNSSNPTTTNTTVSWTVIFSAAVSGVNSADFVLTKTGGVSGESLGSVSGSGTTWTVSANTGSGSSGSGTLGLDLVDDDSIADVITGLRLGGAGTGNGNATGPNYTVNPPPLVLSMTRANASPTIANTTVSWTVTFSSAVSGVDTSDFVLVAAGGASGAGISGVSGSGAIWTVSATTGTSSSGTLGLNLVDDDSIVDPSTGLRLGGSGSGNGSYNGQIYTLAPPAPVLSKTASASSAVVGDVVTFTVVASNPYATPLSAVAVTDTLPTGMSYVTHVATLGSLSASGQLLTWTIPSLPANGSATLTLAVSLSQQGLLTNTVSAPNATPASSGILVLASAVTHFRMDEPVNSWSGAAGEVIDSGGTGLHGRRLISTAPTTTNIINPVPSIASQQPSVVGGFCNAASFDGRAIVEVADSPLFDYTTRLSASAWIYPTAYPPAGGLYSILSNDVNYEFHLTPTGKLNWWWSASSMTSLTTIPLNQWTHVAITFDSTAGGRRQRIYINGVQDGAVSTWQGTLAANNCNFYIGGDVATGAACSIMTARNFLGRIDEVKLYSFELSPAEVVADMTLGRACSGTFDHLRIEHDGVASVCAPEKVTVKACLDSSCSTLYTGNVTVNLSPAGWVGGDTFSFSGGVGTRQLSRGTAGNVTLGSNSVSPTPAAASRCFNGGSESCSMNFAAASCAFDAVEPGMAPQTPIYTKLAGVPFNIDVLALLSSTTINTTYAGPVTVDLVDASGSPCPTGSGLTTATNITFVGGDVGRKQVSFNSANAARDVRVRARVGASAPACSSDNFTVRPQQFTVSSTTATNTATSGAPAIKAGAAFSLSAASVPGYDGTPLVDNSKVTGTPTSGALSGSFTAAPAASGTATGSAFRYGEVGLFGLGQNAVYDSSFTAVDQPGDCVAGFSNVLTGGKYGCSTGSAAIPAVIGSSGFGRFTPDHFTVSYNSPQFRAACQSGGFSYLGQTFNYATAPVVTVQARNASGGATSNYAGSWWKLTEASLTGKNYTAASGTLDTGLLPSPDPVVTPGAGGSGTLSFSSGSGLGFTRPAVPVAPFDAEISLAINVIDGDGVAFAGNPARFGAPAAGNGIAFAGGKAMRWGRLALENAYGPELAALSVPLLLQSFNGSAFVPNSLDSCTSLPVAQLAMTSAFGTVAAPGPLRVNALNPNTTTATLGGFSGGIGSLTLSPPGNGGDGYVDLRANLAALPWLRFDWNGNGVHDNDPTARASFGIHKGRPRLIYQREVVR